jgi:ribose 5-phosphate isomerase B
MKIYIGSDHAGFELKKVLISHLELLGHEIVDKGDLNYDENDDYPDFISLVAEGVAEEGSNAFGIVLGGSGQGEAMEANRLFGIRAAVYYGGDEQVVKASRNDNDANILSLGARFISEDEAKHIVDIFLSTPFSNEERHKRRILKLDN